MADIDKASQAAIDRLNQAANQKGDLEVRAKLCSAEVEAVLEKYGLEMAMKTSAINGQPFSWEFIFANKKKDGAAAPQHRPNGSGLPG